MPFIKVEYSVDIQSSAEKLWDIITDVEHWPERNLISDRNPSSSSRLEAGRTFVVEQDGRKWNLKVTEAKRPQKICWAGNWMGLHAVHEWEFIEEGKLTTAINRECISGWMLFIAYPIIKRRLPITNEQWLADLKTRAEKIKR